MSRKLPPKWVSKAAPAMSQDEGDEGNSPVEGVDVLPLPMGVNREAVQQAEQSSEATPGAMGNPMTSTQYGRECNGDNPPIKDVGSFANGADVRSYGSSPSSEPTPAKPGA